MQASNYLQDTDENKNRALGMDENGGLEEQCLEFGKILGLNRPVSKKVLFAALEVDTYVHNLLVCRRNSEFMDYLLDNPPETSFGKEQTDAKWINRSAKALVNWGKTGFSVVDDETLERRENACLSCANLMEPKERLQKSNHPKNASDRLGERTGDRICRICGCNAGSKMRRSSASCPSKHPGMEGMTRWSEPMQEKT